MNRSLARALLFGVVLLATAGPASAAPVAAGYAAAAVDLAAQESPAATEASETSETPRVSGLPERPPPPRTLRAFWPVFLLFALGWVGIAAYTLTFGRRLRSVAEGLRSVEDVDAGGHRA